MTNRIPSMVGDHKLPTLHRRRYRSRESTWNSTIRVSDYEFCLVLCLLLVGTSKGLDFGSTEGTTESNAPDDK